MTSFFHSPRAESENKFIRFMRRSVLCESDLCEVYFIVYIDPRNGEIENRVLLTCSGESRPPRADVSLHHVAAAELWSGRIVARPGWRGTSHTDSAGWVSALLSCFSAAAADTRRYISNYICRKGREAARMFRGCVRWSFISMI